MMRKHLNLTALLLTFSTLAFGQDNTAVVSATNSNDALFLCIAGIAVVIAIAILCALMMKFNRILLELREKLTFSASTADNGKAATDALQKLDAQLESLRKDIANSKSINNHPAKDTPALSADEIAAKVTASKSFTDMTASVAKCCAEFNKCSKDIENRCSETIANATKSLKQTSEKITAFSQNLNSLDASVSTAPDKAHSLVEREIDKAKAFFSDALGRIENASSSIAKVESQLVCLQELTSRVTDISNSVRKSEERDATMAANVSIVQKGLSDMADGLGKFHEFSEQIPSAALAQSNLAESKALLKAKTDELEAKSVQLSGLTAKTEASETKVRTLEEEKRELLTKNAELLRTLQEAQKSLEESVTVAERRENEFNGLKSQYDGISKRLEILDAKKREAESANATLKERMENLTTELNTAKHEASAATASLQKIKPTYDAMLLDRQGLYPHGLDGAPYNAALQELEKLAQSGSANAELCLRDLAMVNSFLKQEGVVTKDAQEQMLRGLWYFSKNFTSAMKAGGFTPEESCNRLNVWLSFFLEMKDEGFALEMPSIGDGVTLSWMSPSVPGTNTVSAVEAWAVYAEGNASPTFKALVR